MNSLKDAGSRLAPIAALDSSPPAAPPAQLPVLAVLVARQWPRQAPAAAALPTPATTAASRASAGIVRPDSAGRTRELLLAWRSIAPSLPRTRRVPQDSSPQASHAAGPQHQCTHVAGRDPPSWIHPDPGAPRRHDSVPARVPSASVQCTHDALTSSAWPAWCHRRPTIPEIHSSRMQKSNRTPLRPLCALVTPASPYMHSTPPPNGT